MYIWYTHCKQMNEENSNILQKCGLLLKYYNIFIGKYQIL